MTTPLPGLNAPVKYAAADWYYKIPERQIYKVYPVYRPDKEPPNYMAFLSVQNPELAFDPTNLKTAFDWTQAGEAVFSSAGDTGLLTPDDLRNPQVWKRFRLQPDADGSLPGWRYVIRKRSKIELAPTLCGSCHEGLVDGITVPGVPNAWLTGPMFAFDFRRRLNGAKDWELSGGEEVARQFALFSVPWRSPDPAQPVSRMAPNDLWRLYDAITPGVAVRTGTSPVFPPRIPDLIGVKERTLLGNTGSYRHQGIADLMRYAMLETGFEQYTQYGDFRPSGSLPDPSGLERLSDTQAYALALYLYGLKLPANPNRSDPMAKRGQKIFDREGCASCHPAPQYTSGKAIQADDSDPRLARDTRRGTGAYRVPSLQGVWYREPLEHNGSMAALEDWFDPVRLRDDYVPTGFKGDRVQTRAVKGHAYGLKLSFEDRRALMAFLRSL
jgi:cytochrome c553